jgi:hypothetical protein
MYSHAAVAVQSLVPTIQGIDRIWYAGAWTRYGFHEDGILSGIRIAESLGAAVPWGDQLDADRTRVIAGAPVPMLGQARKLFPSEAPLVAVEELPRSAASGLRPDPQARS